jgi:hypothetical protein
MEDTSLAIEKTHIKERMYYIVPLQHKLESQSVPGVGATVWKGSPGVFCEPCPARDIVESNLRPHILV